MRIEHWWFTVPLRLQSTLRGRQAERELDEELQFHLEHKIEEGVAHGLSAEDARYAALRAIDGLAQQKEAMRDMRRIHWLTDFVDDVRYAIRSLRRTPGPTALVVMTLALGIGMTSTPFSMVDALIFRPYPIPHPSGLVTLVSTSRDNSYGSFSYREYLDIRAHTKSYDGVIANAATGSVGFSAEPGATPRIKGGMMVSGNYFRLLGRKRRACGRPRGVSDVLRSLERRRFRPSAAQRSPAGFRSVATLEMASTKRPIQELFPLMYSELRRVAARYLGRERSNHTLQPTALVNEAWLRMQKERGVESPGRTQGLALAAQAMRRVLVDHGHHQKSQKRGGRLPHVELDDLLHAARTAAVPIEDLLTLESALARLEAVDPRGAEVVALRFFSGLSVPEVADHLGVSVSTVEGKWTHARAWLRRDLARTNDLMT